MVCEIRCPERYFQMVGDWWCYVIDEGKVRGELDVPESRIHLSEAFKALARDWAVG